MALASNKKKQRPPSGSRVAALVVFILILGATGGYYLFSPHSKTTTPPEKPNLSGSKPLIPAISSPKSANVTKESPSEPISEHKDAREYPSPTVLPAIKKSETGSFNTAELAIIIDDMGSSISQARQLAAIKVPLTFAVIPGFSSDKEVAGYAASQKIETMIHIPMQSKGWPTQRLEANGLLVSMDSDEIEKRVSGFVQRFPLAVGVNNHMGSEFTEQEEKMIVVLETLKKNDLFFVDSVTSPASVGMNVALRVGVKAARRNVFLDNQQDRSYILEQLNQAVKLARKNGSAIAICHPHPATIAVLVSALPGLADKGVQLVPVSHLVK
jgi:polysaccharide deacetylase 2 family uncharacterized protein YibQ